MVSLLEAQITKALALAEQASVLLVAAGKCDDAQALSAKAAALQNADTQTFAAAKALISQADAILLPAKRAQQALDSFSGRHPRGEDVRSAPKHEGTPILSEQGYEIDTRRLHHAELEIPVQEGSGLSVTRKLQRSGGTHSILYPSVGVLQRFIDEELQVVRHGVSLPMFRTEENGGEYTYSISPEMMVDAEAMEQLIHAHQKRAAAAGRLMMGLGTFTGADLNAYTRSFLPREDGQVDMRLELPEGKHNLGHNLERLDELNAQLPPEERIQVAIDQTRKDGVCWVLTVPNALVKDANGDYTAAMRIADAAGALAKELKVEANAKLQAVVAAIARCAPEDVLLTPSPDTGKPGYVAAPLGAPLSPVQVAHLNARLEEVQERSRHCFSEKYPQVVVKDGYLYIHGQHWQYPVSRDEHSSFLGESKLYFADQLAVIAQELSSPAVKKQAVGIHLDTLIAAVPNAESILVSFSHKYPKGREMMLDWLAEGDARGVKALQQKLDVLEKYHPREGLSPEAQQSLGFLRGIAVGERSKGFGVAA